MGIFIGLTGLNGSGKGEAVSLLVQLGFRSHSLSDVVRGEATLLGRDHSTPPCDWRFKKVSCPALSLNIASPW